MKNGDVIIRPFEAMDTIPLSKIWLEASLLAHPFIGEGRLLRQRALIEEKYLPSADTWVATIGGRATGFISLLGTFVGGLFVDPNHQGLGLGRNLVSHALALRGELSLEVYTDNVGAMGFYTAIGFKELSRRSVDDEGYPFENALLQLVGR